MEIGIPTLTPDGWITDPANIIVKEFEYYISSNYSQSNSYYGNIRSFKYTMNKYREPNEISIHIGNDLKFIYSQYFNNVEPNVSVEIEEGVININIDVICNYFGKIYTLNKSIKTTYDNLGDLNVYDLKLENIYK